MDLREIVEFALVTVIHNLALVAPLTENIVVLNRGRIVEAGPTHRVLGRPQNPYTAALVAAASDVSLARAVEPGNLERRSWRAAPQHKETMRISRWTGGSRW
jgi:peptide/nickel transport system ATP-binding protein